MLRQDFGFGWYPSADALHAPPNCLLRADNLVWDDRGIVDLRPGSSLVYTLADLDVHSLHTAFLAGVRYRLAGAGSNVYANGSFAFGPFDGSGDIAVHSWLGHAFAARGSTRKKYNGTSVSNWGMKGPTVPPIAYSLGKFATSVASFHQAESPAFTADEGTITATFPSGADGAANSALELTPATTGTGRGSVTKLWTTDQDFLTIAGYTGDARDIFDILAFITEPQNVETITVMFGLGTGADPFQSDYLYFDFNLGGSRQSTVTLPAPTVMRQSVQEAVVQAKPKKPAGSGSGDGDDNGPVHGGPAQNVVEFEGNLGGNPGGKVSAFSASQSVFEDGLVFKSREFKGKASNPGWTHLSCMRGQFNRVGTTPLRGWSTVRGFKVVYKALSGATGVVRFDDAQFFGGAGTRALIGRYQFKVRFAHPTGTFMERSPASPASGYIDLIGNAVSLVVPKAILQAKDPQADQIWVYGYGGTLGDFYLFHVAGVTALPANHGLRITEFPKKPDAFWTAQERLRLCTGDLSLPNGGALALTSDGGYRMSEWGKVPDGVVSNQDRRRMTTMDFASPVETPSIDGDLTIEVRADEAEALATDQILERDFRVVPEDIVTIAGPFRDRILVLSQKANERGILWVGERRQPSQFRWSRAFAVGDDTESCYWIACTTGGAYIGTSRDLYTLDGSGNENDDDTVDFELKPVNIASPPVGPELAMEGNGFSYRAKDGWRTFDGAASIVIPKALVDLLYKGKTRYGVSPVNSSGRFRAAILNSQLVAITPEGASSASSRVLHRYDAPLQKWMRHTYPYDLRSIHREVDGTILVGDSAGHVFQLDSGATDNGTDIPVVAWTRLDDFDAPMSRKDPFDMQALLNTGGADATVGLYLDGSESAAASAIVRNSTALLHKKDVSTLPPYRRAQFRITGSFQTFKLYDLSLNHRIRPQHRMAVDTGYIQTGRPDVDWIKEVRLMVNSPSNLTVTVSFNDAEAEPQTCVVTANKTGIYTVPLGREYVGNQPRIQVKTTSGEGTGEVGFELYWIEIRYDGSGNVTEKNILRVSPEGTAA